MVAYHLKIALTCGEKFHRNFSAIAQAERGLILSVNCCISLPRVTKIQTKLFQFKVWRPFHILLEDCSQCSARQQIEERQKFCCSLTIQHFYLITDILAKTDLRHSERLYVNQALR